MRYFILAFVLSVVASVAAGQSSPFGNQVTTWQCEQAHQRQFPNQPAFSSQQSYNMRLYPNGQAEVQGYIQTAAGRAPFQSFAQWRYDGRAVIVQGQMQGGTGAMLGIGQSGGDVFILIAIPQSQAYMAFDETQQGQGGAFTRNAAQCQRTG
ncbi:MAG: hypothetical protein AAFY38_06990 [Pseudomonadota bacterium]